MQSQPSRNILKPIEWVDPTSLKHNPKNRNKHSPEQIDRLADLIKYQGWRWPIIVSNQSGFIVAGHGRLMAAQKLGLNKVPVSFQDFESDEQAYAFLVSDNSIALWAELDLSAINVDIADLGPDFNIDMLGIEGFTIDVADRGTEAEAAKLSDKFIVPPFSVLDQRQGYWQERKQKWMSLGIKSEEGRGHNLLKMSDTILEPDPEKRAKANKIASFKDQDKLQAYSKIRKLTDGGMSPKEARRMCNEDPGAVLDQFGSKSASENTGTSIFDPVLCELIYRWFSQPGALILDPFAGGSVRGIVAAKLDRSYLGIELRKEQVEANRKQAAQICRGKKPMPVWTCDDSRNIDGMKIQADLVFSCPPYADLEVYSDDPRDISNMPYKGFLAIYREIIAKSIEKLRKDRFACFVVTEVREKKGGGLYRNFVPDTIQAFEDAGARFYNEAILINCVGTLALRAGKTFSASRKLGRTHQNVLVFCKGDPIKAAKACGEVEIVMPEGTEA